jgi:hypothetical protein
MTGCYLVRGGHTMKCLPFVVAFAALVPSLVCAQNPQSSDCRTLEAAGNFVGADEALVNGLVCKVGKPKINSAASTQVAGEAAERSTALSGITEPDSFRSTERGGASSAAGTTPAATPGSAASDSTAGGAPQPSSFGMVPQMSLGEIARAYREKAGRRTTTAPKEGGVEGKKPAGEVEGVATLSHETPTPATAAELQPARKTQVSAAAEAPAAAKKEEITAGAPATVLSTPGAALGSTKNEVIAAPQAQPNAVKQGAGPTTADSLLEPAVKLETNLASGAVTSASAPEVPTPARTEIVASAPRTLATEQTSPSLAPGAREVAPEPEPERSTRVEVFAASRPPATDLPLQPTGNTTAEDSPFKEGQAPTCVKNVSLGSIDNQKLFLAIPEWVLKWHEKNQKRFPGICFSDSLMAGAQNYLVVFYMAAPPVAATETLAKISAPAELAPGNGGGSFTANYGSTWHYTYEGTVTTTITSVSAEKAPHNQPSTLLYVTAYSEQGIPISHHRPPSVTKPVEKLVTKPGKSNDASLLASRGMEELLNQTVADIAKM